MEEFVEKAKKGDKEAFTKLVLNLRNDMYKISRTRLTKEEDIDDVTQITIVNAFKKIQQLKDDSKFKSWIFKILINNCNKRYKQNKRENEMFVPLDEETIYFQVFDPIEKVNDTIDFYKMLEVLEQQDSLIIVLYYSAKCSDKEIANILKMNENTVKSRRTRAKEKLRNVEVKREKGGIKHE